MTNNPDKIADLEKLGIKVETRVPLICINDVNKDYVEAKKVQHNHLIA
jgi:GTP cyclohydrolase II